MRVGGTLLFQLFKYSVYAFLIANIGAFLLEDHAAAQIRFAEGASLVQWFGAYAATIDTAAWVALLLIFELETFVLEGRPVSPRLSRLLRSIAAISFLLIFLAFVGYLQTLLAMHRLNPVEGMTSLCAVADNGAVWADGEAEYLAITPNNCDELSTAGSFRQYAESGAFVDQPGADAIRQMAWADFINSTVWILVVLVLQIDVWLKERKQLVGTALRASLAAKALLYPTLFFTAIFWGIRGELIDFWDASLWLVAFLFIENNVFEWRRGKRDESRPG